MRIQNDALEHYFGLYRQISGSHYQISYNQKLESERRLQLLNILKVFAIKYCSTTEVSGSLKEYFAQFSDNLDNINDEQLGYAIELYMYKLNEIPLNDFEVSRLNVSSI